LLFVLSFIIFGKDEWLAIIVWLIASCFLIIFAEKQFNKTGKGRRIKKADQELGELKRKRDELEKKLDLLEKKKKSKGKI
jgi:hypothetical protein